MLSDNLIDVFQLLEPQGKHRQIRTQIRQLIKKELIYR